MKVKMLRNLGRKHELGDLQEGDVHDVDVEMAASLIDTKLAEPLGDLHGVGDDDENLHAVPKGPKGKGPKGKGPKPSAPEPAAETGSLDPLSDQLSAAIGTDHLDK